MAIELETHPSRYKHWRLAIEPPLAFLTMAVAEDAPVVPGYKLKLNSYDLGVDLELADAVERLPDPRFHRRIGVFSGAHFDLKGRRLSEEQCQTRRDEFLPSEKDQAYVRNLMAPVLEPGKIAHRIAKPSHGIRGLPFEFE